MYAAQAFPVAGAIPSEGKAAAAASETTGKRKRAPRGAGTRRRGGGGGKKRTASQRDNAPTTVVSIPASAGGDETTANVKTEHAEPKEDRDDSKDESKQPPAKRAKKAASYLGEIKDMMYTFGDVRNGSPESHGLVETIVKQYLVGLTHQTLRQAHKRGVARIVVSDLIFQIRRDVPKLNRLKEFLGWKEVRKKFGKGDTEDIASANAKELTKKKVARKIIPTWDLVSSLRQESDEEDSEDEDEVEMDLENKERLRIADEMTRSMTKEEYIEYTECRQASFTYKKNKKFREWLGTVLKVKLNDEVIEVLGYLAWEMVGFLTQQALIVKKQMEEGQYRGMRNRTGSFINVKLQSPTFDRDNEKTPLLPEHIREAIRRDQPLKHSLVEFTAVHIYHTGMQA